MTFLSKATVVAAVLFCVVVVLIFGEGHDPRFEE